jgi:IS605 OrfB family transposase
MLESRAVKLTLQTQLLPDGDQAKKLSATMRAFNSAADWLAGEAFRLKTANKVELQQLYYRQLRDDFGISSQMAIRCIAQVCEAYGRDKSIRPRFRKYASVPFDQRLMSFKGAEQKRDGKRPLNAKRKLKAISGRERRFKANTNHTIAKKIVAKATDTGRGIAIEELEGIRNRIRFRQKQRDRMSKWAFAELRDYIEYKATLSGVKVQPVDPRDTSRRCPECNHVSKKNRIRRDVFLCDECGYFDHADIVGAKNIRSGALVIAREVSAAAASRVSRETSSIYNRGASA